MKFENIQDLDIPIEDAFDMLSEYEFFERMAMRRGAEVKPRAADAPKGLGAAWDINVPWRGNTVAMQIDVVKYERPSALGFQANAPAIEAQLDLDLMALNNHKTRLTLVTDISAKTLTGRLLLQSMKLTRGRLEKRVASRIAEHASNMEKRYRAAQTA